ncbi:MAG: AI-2E family transporter, partial [Gemmatimonadales bacterium]|nr:AI-2E family transporter [Gemmatimonadales bacterium]
MTTTSPPAHSGKRDPRPRQVGWRTRDILRATAIVAGVYVALQLLWVGRSVFLVGFLGVLLGITLAAGVDWLERRRVPRVLGALLLVLSAIGVLVGLGLLTAPRISEQVRQLRQQVPQAIDQVEQWVQQRAGGIADLIQAPAPPAGRQAEGSARQGQGGEAQESEGQGPEAQARDGQGGGTGSGVD